MKDADATQQRQNLMVLKKLFNQLTIECNFTISQRKLENFSSRVPNKMPKCDLNYISNQCIHFGLKRMVSNFRYFSI